MYHLILIDDHGNEMPGGDFDSYEIAVEAGESFYSTYYIIYITDTETETLT